MQKFTPITMLILLATMDSLSTFAKADKDVLPLYFAWFVEEPDSTSFLTRSFKTLADCLQAVPEFLYDAQKITGHLYISDILAHYTRDNADEVLHCTAAYNGVYPNYTDGAEEYANKPEVKVIVKHSKILC